MSLESARVRPIWTRKIRNPGKGRLVDISFGAALLALEAYQIAASGRIDLFFSVVGLSLVERGIVGYAPGVLSSRAFIRARLSSGLVLAAIWLALLLGPFVGSGNLSGSLYVFWLGGGVAAGVGASVLLSSVAWIKYGSKPPSAPQF